MQWTDEKKPVRKTHNVILEDRRKLMVSGVTDVDSFDEEAVVLYTDLGELTVRGSSLHMNKYSVDSGDVSVEGDIESMSYRSETPRSQGGVLGRIFR
jgi:sporulation protein YabP